MLIGGVRLITYSYDHTVLYRGRGAYRPTNEAIFSRSTVPGRPQSVGSMRDTFLCEIPCSSFRFGLYRLVTKHYALALWILIELL